MYLIDSRLGTTSSQLVVNQSEPKSKNKTNNQRIK